MSTHFDVKPSTIGDAFLEPKHFFEIPRFQRPYSWEEGNIEEFWDTIFSVEPVFLGTVIFNKRRLDKEKVIEIIDGQQRYLTIHILGAVLRDTCRSLEKEFSDADFEDLAHGTAQSIVGKPDKWNKTKFYNYLTPGESIKDFFNDYVQAFDSEKRIDGTLKVKKKSEEERIKEAYLTFKRLLDEALQPLDLDGKKTLLRDLIDQRLAKHFFARIEIDDEDLAYEIFETVNAKGVDLNVADLIKNQIFRHVINGDPKRNDSAKDRWALVTENVGAANIPIKDFLSYYWSSKYGYVADRKLYKAIREHFREDERWDAFLDDLVENSVYIRNIFSGTLDDLEDLVGDWSEAVKLFESLRVLRNTKAKTWSILYLCMFRNFFGPARKVSFTPGNRWELIAKFTFLYYEVLNLSGNWYFKEIWNFSKRIEEFGSLMKSTKDIAQLFKDDLFTQFESKLPRPEAFSDGFVAISYKESKKARIIIRYVLSQLEERLAGKFDVGFDETKVSIEHFLPQDPKEWGCTKKDIKDVVNSIGNLVLISKRKNGALGNKNLESKILELGDQASKLRLVEQLLANVESRDWDFSLISTEKNLNAIEVRGRELAKLGFEIWVNDLRGKMGF